MTSLASVLSILTDTTCGEACWHAREDVCRCECGGRNHGCLRDKNGARPVRACKLDGARYELFAVGFFDTLYPQTKELLKALPIKWEDRIKCQSAPNGEVVYTYHWKETDPGSPVRLKPASAAQLGRWEELAGFRTHADVLERRRSVYLLWKAAPIPEAVPTLDLTGAIESAGSILSNGLDVAARGTDLQLQLGT